MTLEQFLAVNTPLTYVDLLPDSRLTSAVIGSEATYGVLVEDIPWGVPLTRVAATYAAPIITAATMTFDARDYVMLGSTPQA